MTRKKFREVLVRDLVIQSHKANVTVSVACLEAGQPHLHPNLADWKSNNHNIGLPKAGKGAVVCVP
jgi:hypothetical protein